MDNGPFKAGVSMLQKKTPHALSIRCTGDKTDIVLEVMKLNAISSGRTQYFFSLENNFWLVQELKKSQLTGFTNSIITLIILIWKNISRAHY